MPWRVIEGFHKYASSFIETKENKKLRDNGSFLLKLADLEKNTAWMLHYRLVSEHLSLSGATHSQGGLSGPLLAACHLSHKINGLRLPPRCQNATRGSRRSVPPAHISTTRSGEGWTMVFNASHAAPSVDQM